MTHQMADDSLSDVEVLRVLDREIAATGAQSFDQSASDLMRVRAAVAALQAERDKLEALRGQVAGLVAAAEEASSSLAHHAQSAYCSLGDADESVITALNAELLAIKES